MVRCPLERAVTWRLNSVHCIIDMAIIPGPFHGRDRLPSPRNEVGLFVPAAEVFPGTVSDERTLISLLETLDRDDTLFMAARLNIIISGPGDFVVKPRQQQALFAMCSSALIDRVNDFARRHKEAGVPAVFFPGQLLELMRWAARYGKKRRNDGTTFASAECRERFVKAALITGDLWAKRVYGGKLTAGPSINEVRLKALGALRKGVEEDSRRISASRSGAGSSCSPSIFRGICPISRIGFVRRPAFRSASI